MTVKPYINGSSSAREGLDQKLALLDARRVAAGKQGGASNPAPVQRPETAAALDPVRVSNISRELSAALGANAMDEVFDQDKVDSIRREILEGRFPIDEERLAKKFRELEEELGNLGA
jgi:flagellar biosynthesis anti-sigma factor FlgM